MDWKTLYPRSEKPTIAQISDYLAPDVRPLFAEFNQTLRADFGLGYVLVTYSKANGWIYRYGHSGLILLENVCFHDGLFSVEGMDVKDRPSLSAAISIVRRLFEDGFMERFALFHTTRNKKRKQLQKNKQPKVENLSQCRWPAAVSHRDMQRLYQSDANGLLDEALLNDVGFTLYTRCVVAREIYDLMEKGKVKCLGCGHVLDYAAGIMECPCGQHYTYREYRKSYRANNMPRGAASPIFDKFIADWEKAKENAMKMRLIDNLIHEFHVSIITGNQNRPVGVNLIQGTKAQVTALIEELAYDKA